jgi:hypothetical protein
LSWAMPKGHCRLGVTRMVTNGYNQNWMSSNAPTETQFALAGVLATLFSVSAAPSGGAAFPFASQSLR